MPKPPAIPQAPRHANGRFGAGNPGRPRGARNRLSERVATAILQDFEDNQDQLLADLRTYKMTIYTRLVTHLLPKSVEIGLPDYADFSDAEVADRIEDLRLALDIVANGEGTLHDVESVLTGEAHRIDD